MENLNATPERRGDSGPAGSLWPGVPRRILIAGASGLIGRALTARLEREGHEVWWLVRRPPARPREIFWDPGTGVLDRGAIEGMDAVVNLAGENIAAGRWTEARRTAILRSRVEATRTLVVALQEVRRRPEVFVNASAVGFYGERGDEGLTEGAGIGQGFLPEVCLAWETHAEGAARNGVRTVLLRFGVVLAAAGGALAKMLPVFRVGLGGRLGHGRQWMGWIGLEDAVRVVGHALRETRCRGAVNVVAPEEVTQVEFAATLGRVLRRPAILPVPAAVLRLIFGQMAEETLLASTRAEPRALRKTGFSFRYPALEEALCHELGCTVPSRRD